MFPSLRASPYVVDVFYEVTQMIDIAFVAVTLVFFLLSWLYVRACARV